MWMWRKLLLICIFIATSMLLLSNNLANAQENVAQQEQPQANADKSTAPPDKKTTESNPENSSPKENENTPPITILRSELNIPAPISVFEQQQNDLMHYLPAEKIKPIQAGVDSYISIEELSLTKNNKGVAILLPDWQQTAVSPQAINFLRKKLPNDGWTTISISPPNMPENYPSHALTSNERLEENQKNITNYKAKLKPLIIAVMEKAKNYPGLLLVIAQGSHAALLVDLYQAQQVPSPSALIMLSSYMPTNEENQLFAKNLTQCDIPVLDLLLIRDSQLVLESALLRKQLTAKELKVDYRQKKFNNISSGFYPLDSLHKEINGWLVYMGW